MTLAGHVDEMSRSVVEGWVVDTERPDEPVFLSILVDGVLRGSCVTVQVRTDVVLPDGASFSGKCGFHFRFDPPLSPFLGHRIEVIETWSGTRLPNGVRSLLAPRAGGDGGGLTPILLTSTGRTGTTLIMSELARHSRIVLGDHYPFEIKQIAYYAAAFRALAADADRERSTSPESMLAPELRHFIGPNPFNMSGLFELGGGKGALREFYETTVPSSYATLFRRLIAEFYATLANAQGKATAAYFCEKGDLSEAAARGARLFFDTVKDIVIVRDPRDLLCSAIAFWNLGPDEAMAMLETTVPRLGEVARDAGPDTIVIRYEDLVREPAATRRMLSRFLDLDLETPHRAAALPDSHRTSRDPAASIGRWREELSKARIEACELTFGWFMRDFDYPSATPPRRNGGAGAARAQPAGNRLIVAEGARAVEALDNDEREDGVAGVTSRKILRFTFGRDGTGAIATLTGWSLPEDGFVWSNARESRLRLPPIPVAGDYQLNITVGPFTHGSVLPSQRMTLWLGGRKIGTVRARDICVLSVPVPASLCGSGEAIGLTFGFPDAARPSDIAGVADDRTLGFALHRIMLSRTEAADGPARRTNVAPLPLHRVPERVNGDAGDHGAPPLGLCRILRWAAGLPALTWCPDTEVHRLPGFNASRFIRLILALEAEFGIELCDHEVDSIVTMRDIARLLEARTRPAG